MLFPSGEDANPLNRRLPAEVVTRRRPETRRTRELPAEEDIKVDLKGILSVKPESRAKWLAKAFESAESGKTPVSELYCLITSRKFASNLKENVVRKLSAVIFENIGRFSSKQQRYLRSEEWPLAAAFPDGGRPASDSDHGDEGPSDNVEDMMARCRAFVRENARSFDDRVSEARIREDTARERERLGYERHGMTAADDRTRIRVTEAEEQARREARQAEERLRREAFERVERDRRMKAEAEATRNRVAQEERARVRKLEDEADSSMDLLEQLVARKGRAPSPKETCSRGLSRSRSISSHRDKGREEPMHSPSKECQRKRRRSRDRRRRQSSSSRHKYRREHDSRDLHRRHGSSGISRDEAIRRRMAEREAGDTTRMPVARPVSAMGRALQ